ncbi:hypothetical protein ALP93_200328 [Pseudomonas syringae pv. helianthi]|nr:hypothetical protein ALP93_200328 [Pseudomonas syringae pv. helianthi]
MRIKLCGRYALNQNAPLTGIVKTQQKVENRRLARTGRPDQRQGFARLDGQGQVIDCIALGTRRVGKRDTFQHQTPADALWQALQVCSRRLDLATRLKQLADPFGCPGGALQIANDLAQRTKRHADHQRIKYKRCQLTAGNTPIDHVHAAHPQHYSHRTQHQNDHQRDQPGALQDPFAGGIERLFHRVRKALFVLLLMVIGLHRLDLPQRLGHVTAHVGDPILTLARQVPHPPPEHENRRDDQRQCHHHNTGELGVGDEQQHNATDDHQYIAQEHRQRRANHRLQQRGVGGQSRLDFRTAIVFIKARMQLYQVIEDFLAQVGDHTLADP